LFRWWWYGMGIMGKKRQNWSRSLCLIKPLAMGFSRIRPTLHLMWALIRVKSFALGLYHIWKRWVHQIMQILWTSCIYFIYNSESHNLAHQITMN
jgi:disulfide bond formation protein DsbB